MDATQSFIARVIRAQDAVVARDGSRNAFPCTANFALGAGVAIIAVNGVVNVFAPGGRVAKIAGANVVIVAIKSPGKRAPPFTAYVPDGAGVQIVAWLVVCNMKACPVRIARVFRAGISIVAVGCVLADANSSLAPVPNGAFVQIVAFQPFGGRNHGTPTGHRVTRCNLAQGIRARLRQGAGHDRSRDYGATIGQTNLVAIEASIADIRGIQERAVLVRVARTVQGDSTALATIAPVVPGTRVRIVAPEVIRSILAIARSPDARVGGANILVVAVLQAANAPAKLASVRFGAWVLVIARAFQ
jgi:hypothetical protein